MHPRNTSNTQQFALLEKKLFVFREAGSRARVKGVATTPLGSFQTCVATHVYPFYTKNNIINYNISCSEIDHYKKFVAIPVLDSLIIQVQDQFLRKIATPAPSALSNAMDYSK